MRSFAIVACSTLLALASSMMTPGGIGGASMPAQQTALNAAATSENLRITGIVRDSGTRQPTPGVEVRLREPNTGFFGTPRSTETDANGRFLFSGLGPGSHSVSVAYPGESETAGRPGERVLLTRGEPTPDVELWMTALGTVSGRVTDIDGNAIAGACVRLMHREWSVPEGGYFQLQPSMGVVGRSCLTDEDGLYMADAPTGEHYLQVDIRSAETRSYSHYVPLYYPGVVDPNRAVPITVLPWTDLPRFDLTLNPESFVLFPVQFEISLPEYVPGIPEPLSTYLDGIGGAPLARVRSVDGAGLFRRVSDSFVLEALGNGVFRTPPLPSGEYEMTVDYPTEVSNRIYSEFQAVFEGEWTEFDPIAKIRFTVDDEPLDLGRIAPIARFDVSGRLVVRRQGLDDGNLDLDSLPRISLGNAGGSRTAALGPDGSFTFQNLFPGVFRLAFDADRLAGNWYLAAASSRGVDILAHGLSVDAGSSSPMEIVLADDAGHIEGQVRDGGDSPVPYAQIVLIPPSQRRGPFSLFRQAYADQDGTFTIEKVPPGEYRLLAFRETGPRRSPLHWQSPEFLREFEMRGLELTVDSGSRMQLTVESTRMLE